MLERPLAGEPLPLDLVNTWWVERGTPRDLFDEPGGLAGWLGGHGLRGPAESVEGPLRQARAALRAVLDEPGEESERRLDAVLGQGRVRYVLRGGVAGEELDAEPAWLPAWRCAVGYLELVRTRPDRIRGCAHPACVLYFYDTSRNGTRRWCSMDGCGSRTKSARHYRRTRSDLS